MSSPDSPASSVDAASAAKLLAAALNPSPVSSPAFAWEPPPLTEVAGWFPDYEVQALTGRGAMGAVYRAVQRKLDRPVAIKLLPPEIAAREGAAARFEREGRAMARLNHPNIVALHDFGRTAEGHLYIVMEYVEGADLSRIMHAEKNGVHVTQALEIVTQICDALQYAHSRGFVHRDIKPGNILVDAGGRVKIADFGLAKLLEPDAAAGRLTMTGAVLGTPDYTAPEQLKGGEVDHRADIYSLGVMLYELLTGDLPRGAWELPSRRSPSAGPGLDAVVTRALQTEPANRYQQASEVKAAVAVAGTAPPAPATLKVPAKPWPARRILFWLMLLCALWMKFVVPASDLLTWLFLGGPFLVVALYFHLSRKPAGPVAGVLAGVALCAAAWFTAHAPFFQEAKIKPGAIPFDLWSKLNVAERQLQQFEMEGLGANHPIIVSQRDEVEALKRMIAALLEAHLQPPVAVAEKPAADISSALQQFAESRAAVLTDAMKRFVSAQGAMPAAAAWKNQPPEARYNLIKGYVAYGPATLAEYTPAGYAFVLPAAPDGVVTVRAVTAVNAGNGDAGDLVRAQEEKVEQARLKMLEIMRTHRIVDLASNLPGSQAVEPEVSVDSAHRPDPQEYPRAKVEYENQLKLLDEMRAAMDARKLEGLKSTFSKDGHPK